MLDSKKLVLEFDDLHFLDPENCTDIIQDLVSVFPNIKLSFFTVANLRQVPIYNSTIFCDTIRKYIDSNNLEILIHGNTHSMEEFKHVTYDTAIQKIKDSESILNEAGILFKKVFRGPHWGLNQNTIKALIELGYTHIYNHEDYRSIELPGIKYVYYNWNLKDNPPQDKVLIAHGHTHNVCDNGIREVKNKIKNFISNNQIQHIFTQDI